MGILKKSTPATSETKIIPDEKEGLLPFTRSGFSGDDDASSDAPAGELSVDVFQTADEIIVVAPVAGVLLKDIFISITDGVLTIKGRRNLEFAASTSDYLIQECFWGNFSRAIILPSGVDTSSVKASFHDAILTIRIPKIEDIRTRVVEIKEE